MVGVVERIRQDARSVVLSIGIRSEVEQPLANCFVSDAPQQISREEKWKFLCAIANQPMSAPGLRGNCVQMITPELVREFGRAWLRTR